MEILILAMIFSVVVKRGAEDLIHAAKGGTPQRYAAASARRKSGAAGRYFGQLWDDSWESMLDRHNHRVAERGTRPPGPSLGDRWQRGSLLFRQARWNAHNRFKRAVARHDEKRRTKAARPRPEYETVPGTVVPNADERQTEPPARSWIWRRAGWKCRICGSTQGVAEISFGEGFKGFNTGLRYCPKHMVDYGPGGAKIDYGPDPSSVPGQDGAQDEDGDRPQDRPVPEPRLVPDKDGRTDLQFGEDGDDPTGVSSCPECQGTVLVDGEICLSCRDRQEQRNQHHEDQSGPDSGPEEDYTPYKELTHHQTWLVETPEGREFITDDPEMYANLGYKITGVDGYDHANGFEITTRYQPYKSTPTTTEGPTMTTTMPTDTEVTSLNKAIQYSESTAHVAREMVNSIDFTVASLASGGVTGIAVAEFTKAKEDFGSIASAFDRAAQEFKDQLAIQEAYNANPGAGTKEFIMGGR